MPIIVIGIGTVIPLKSIIYSLFENINEMGQDVFDSLEEKDATQLYDELIKSNLLKQIYDILNKYGEFEELHRNLLHLAKSLIEYSDSALGIIDGIASRYDEEA